jgi:hypothetical protein
MSAPAHYWPDPEWDAPDDEWIDNYEAQFEDARDPYLIEEGDNDGR